MTTTQTLRPEVMPRGIARALPPLTEEQRRHQRREVGRDVWLTDLSGQTVLRCRCVNVSAGGLYAMAPVGYGLGVGQRYGLRLSPEPRSGGTFLLGDSLGYATVIRTHLNVGADPNAVGFAVRFDTPLYFPI